ncbi:MAG: hypothetical protein K8R54_04940 [Bacteroidales bacterium]|nr:hypothetical protein [Bacteroidales bacterium]
MKNFSTIYSRLDFIKQSVRMKCTGTAEELSGKMSISERTLFYHFFILKQFGYDIEYSSVEKTYFYY